MRKEVLIAIVLGLILGGLLVYGIYVAGKSTNSQFIEQPNSPTPVVSEVSNILTINSPQDGDLFDTSTATVSGQTAPGNAVIIVTETEQLIPELTSTGNFAVTIDLIRGGNLIEISAITPTGLRQDIILNLVYTSQ